MFSWQKGNACLCYSLSWPKVIPKKKARVLAFVIDECSTFPKPQPNNNIPHVDNQKVGTFYRLYFKNKTVCVKRKWNLCWCWLVNSSQKQNMLSKGSQSWDHLVLVNQPCHEYIRIHPVLSQPSDHYMQSVSGISYRCWESDPKFNVIKTNKLVWAKISSDARLEWPIWGESYSCVSVFGPVCLYKAGFEVTGCHLAMKDWNGERVAPSGCCYVIIKLARADLQAYSSGFLKSFPGGPICSTV